MRTTAACIIFGTLWNFTFPAFSESSAVQSKLANIRIGTAIKVNLSETIESSNANQKTAHCQVTEGVPLNGEILIPPKSDLVVSVSRIKGPSNSKHFKIILCFKQIVLPDGQKISIKALPETRGGVLIVERNGTKLSYDAREELIDFEKIDDSKSADNHEKEWVVVVSGKKSQDVNLQTGDQFTIKLIEQIDIFKPNNTNNGA